MFYFFGDFDICVLFVFLMNGTKIKCFLNLMLTSALWWFSLWLFCWYDFRHYNCATSIYIIISSTQCVTECFVKWYRRRPGPNNYSPTSNNKWSYYPQYVLTNGKTFQWEIIFEIYFKYVLNYQLQNTSSQVFWFATTCAQPTKNRANIARGTTDPGYPA